MKVFSSSSTIRIYQLHMWIISGIRPPGGSFRGCMIRKMSDVPYSNTSIKVNFESAYYHEPSQRINSCDFRCDRLKDACVTSPASLKLTRQPIRKHFIKVEQLGMALINITIMNNLYYNFNIYRASGNTFLPFKFKFLFKK